MPLLSTEVHLSSVPCLQESDKCFECDSRQPGRQRISHRIENVIYLTDGLGEDTWWQSANGRSNSRWRTRVALLDPLEVLHSHPVSTPGQEDVSIRLNLEAEFHFTHLIMKFKVRTCLTPTLLEMSCCICQDTQEPPGEPSLAGG